MKIWIKLVIASALGIAIGFALPGGNKVVSDVLQAISTFAVGFGRYALVPLLLFTVPVAVYELCEDKTILKTTWRSVLYSFAATCGGVLLGVIAPVVMKPARIPLVAEAARLPTVPDGRDLVLSLFPANAFDAIFSAGGFILPLLVLCYAIGLAFTHDRTLAKPVVVIFDALSRIVYQINSFLVEVVAVLVIPLAAAAVYGQRQAAAAPVYGSLLLVVAVETAVAALVVIPLAAYIAGGRKNPFPRVYGMIGPVLAAAASGDALFAAGAQLRHAKESLGIRRRSGSVSAPLAFVFGKAGTALISSTAFIAVLNSISGIGLGFKEVLQVLATVPFVMILAGAVPGAGPATAVMALCAMQGGGFESGYLLIVPVAIPLAACAVALDLLAVGTISFVVAEQHSSRVDRDLSHYI